LDPISSPLGAIENLWENAPPRKIAYNLVVCPPRDQIKKVPIYAYILRIS